MTCRLVWTMALWLLILPLVAQPDRVTATLTLSDDTMAIGRKLTATLRVEHPAKVVVEFPAPRDFAPFEIIETRPRPTESQAARSVDVVEYDIRTFALAAKQQLRLPYSWYSRRDTGSGFIVSDTLRLQSRVGRLSDSLTYRVERNLLPLSDPTDYFRLTLIGFAVVLLLSSIGFLMRRPIARMLARRQLRSQWQKASRDLQRLRGELNQEKQLEGINNLWRAYLDPVNRRHLGAYTTTELQEAVHNLDYLHIEEQRSLLNASELRDRVVFAGQRIPETQVDQLLRELQRVFDRAYAYRKARLHASR